jgi:peptide/nickel transport system ATP-binding protein
LAALPQRNKPGGRLNQIPGSMPTLGGIPEGCSFHPRCQWAEAECARRAPLLREIGNGQRVACHFAGEEGGP